MYQFEEGGGYAISGTVSVPDFPIGATGGEQYGEPGQKGGSAFSTQGGVALSEPGITVSQGYGVYIGTKTYLSW
jgi:hypothetical protein